MELWNGSHGKGESMTAEYYSPASKTADSLSRLGDVINRFRSSIDLAPVPATEGPCLAEALEIPMTYCWSPALVPKPRDWPEHIGMHDACNYGPTS